MSSPGFNNFGWYYQNTGTSYINPYGLPVPGVDNPVNTNVEQTNPAPPQGGINNNVVDFV
jgi:hypothetical protein